MKLDEILKNLNYNEDPLILNLEEKETLKIYIHQLEQVIQRIKEII